MTAHASRLPRVPRALAEPLVLMVAPLAPHIAEELWQRLGHPSSLAREPFPEPDPVLAGPVTVTVPVQVNGKVRCTIEVRATATRRSRGLARQEGRVVGCAALEVYADGALLRSVAIALALQHHGVGQSLTAAALQLAEDLRLPAVYLLTTTAERFFPKFGFERIERGAVPASVQTSIEFTSACPSSATVMRKVL